MSRSPLVRFAPFLLVTVLHLVGLFTGAVALSTATKPLLMIALLVALLWSTWPPRGRIVLLATVGVLFCWFGDVMLTVPGGIGFLLGLGGFLLAHVANLVLFSRSLHRRRVPRPALVLVVWWVALLAVLAPHLGALLVPVALYGLALGASAAAALGCNRFVAVGGVTFLVSDTILAFKFFYPGFALWQADFLIMLLYCSGVGLIIYGVTREVAASRAVREPVPTTA